MEQSLKRASKNKEHKSNTLKLKLIETKQVLNQVSESNEKINSLLNGGAMECKDKALVSTSFLFGFETGVNYVNYQSKGFSVYV